ncbi:hypothetical protein [Parahaliea aestuarii]|uniref:Uncharacterized protein n=1 Tax=Parahaliea aestuarii TaxID=1852021 RepID=A0A5C8ZVD0_9GAMM|nr:hypothetical protein [Parahaliea aestuarii]TXS92495.1 hypothetical protein FVW59_08750 [Parahaliea aestuarii]
MIPYFRRLFPAAFTTAAFAALAHAVLVAIAAGSIGAELVYIAALSFVVALVVAAPCGAVLLATVGTLKLKPIPSLLLFLVAIQVIAVGLEMYFFENGISDTSWQYGLISVPASLIAWHQSVYFVHKNI